MNEALKTFFFSAAKYPVFNDSSSITHRPLI